MLANGLPSRCYGWLMTMGKTNHRWTEARQAELSLRSLEWMVHCRRAATHRYTASSIWALTYSRPAILSTGTQLPARGPMCLRVVAGIQSCAENFNGLDEGRVRHCLRVRQTANGNGGHCVLATGAVPWGETLGQPDGRPKPAKEKPTPCPFCGEVIRTSGTKQVRFCARMALRRRPFNRAPDNNSGPEGAETAGYSLSAKSGAVPVDAAPCNSKRWVVATSTNE